MAIGEKIKRRRLELEWSQRELARRMGYKDNTTLTKIERGLVDVSQTRVVQFAEVLGVTIAYLMDWEEEEKQSSELSIKKKEFIKRIEKMSDAQLERLEQILAIVEKTDI